MGEICQERQLALAALRLTQPEQLRDGTLESRKRHRAWQAVRKFDAEACSKLKLLSVTGRCLRPNGCESILPCCVRHLDTHSLDTQEQ